MINNFRGVKTRTITFLWWHKKIIFTFLFTMFMHFYSEKYKNNTSLQVGPTCHRDKHQNHHFLYSLLLLFHSFSTSITPLDPKTNYSSVDVQQEWMERRRPRWAPLGGRPAPLLGRPASPFTTIKRGANPLLFSSHNTQNSWLQGEVVLLRSRNRKGKK